MKVTPNLKITRFAQLEAGDLHLCWLGGEPCVAFVAVDPTENGQKLEVPLGPTFRAGTRGPTLVTPANHTVASFGKDYALRLPVSTPGWQEAEPEPDRPCILLVEDRAYFRVDFGGYRGFIACYVDVASGLICTIGGGHNQQFARPAGTALFATEWELLTTEPEPRVILNISAPEPLTAR
jgi:hypothetical protein